MVDAGWYDDPQDPSRLRYHDGASWTDEVLERHVPQQATPPPPAPAAAPTPVPVQDGRAGEEVVHVRVPGVPMRLAGYVVDQVLAVLVALPFILYAVERLHAHYPGLGDLSQQEEISRRLAVPGSPGHLWSMAMLASVAVAAMLLETVCTARWGGSPAKLMLGLQVRGAAGRADWAAALTRSLVKQLYLLLGYVPVAGFLATLLWAMDAVTLVRHPQRRSLHDLLARTLVEVKPVPGVGHGRVSA